MGWHDEEDDLRKVRVVGPSRRANMKLMAMASVFPTISTMNPNPTPTPGPFKGVEYVGNERLTPKMAFTPEEREKLTKLHGKAKKAYVNELKEKYDRVI